MNQTVKGVVLVAVLGLSTPAIGGWNQFQGNAAHTGYSPNALSAPSLTPLWSYHAQGQVAYDPYFGSGSAAIVNGSVFTTTISLVSRFDGQSGEVIWQTLVKNQPTSPSVLNGIVYVDTFLSSYDLSPPAIIGLDAQNGEKNLRIRRDGQWSTGSRVTAIGSFLLSESGFGDDLHAWDTAGNHQWYADIDQQSYWIPAADEANAYLYLASSGGHTGALYVWDLTTGNMKGKISHRRSESNSYRQSVALGSNNNALAITTIKHPANPDYHTLVNFDLNRMSIGWEFDGEFLGPPAVANGIVAIPDEDVLRILDERTGTTLWTWNGGFVFGNVAMTNRYAFVNAGIQSWPLRASVHAIDLKTGESVWNSQGIFGNIAIDGRLLVITNADGVYAYGAIPEPTSLVLFVSLIAPIMWQRSARRNAVFD